MSKTIVAVFASHQEVKATKEALDRAGLPETVFLNNLPKFTPEESSYKLDGVISGVSNAFIGLPVFVNPMHAAGLPPQETVSNLTEQRWAEYGIDKNAALRYQSMMTEGKSLTAYDWDEGSSLPDTLRAQGALEIHIHTW